MSQTTTPAAAVREPAGTIYNRTFWLAYLTNASLVTANALTFRFAELVKYLGGTEAVAGTIISTGVFGALVARLFLGQAIDRYGTGRLWMLSSLIFVAASASFIFCRDVSWLIYSARLCFAVGAAGMFTCSIVHIQNQVPAHRRTEVIGNLGTSGFIGMIAGTQLGDVIFRFVPDGHARFVVLFGGAALLGLVYFSLVLFLNRGENHMRPPETPAAHRLLFRYWPGGVLAVALMMGVGLSVTTVFLTRFATHLGLGGIGTFFTCYSASAFAFRISARTWSRTIGRHRMILLGLAGHCLGHSLLPWVRSEWHFLVPALACGFGHALLFPAVVSLGSGKFPIEYRGSGTTLTLGFVELGMALSAPVLGGIIDYFGGVGFTQMFYTSAGTALAVGLIYAFTTARTCDREASPEWETGHHSTPDDDAAEPSSDVIPVPLSHVGRSA